MIFNDLTANENYTKKIKEQLNSFNQELITENSKENLHKKYYKKNCNETSKWSSKVAEKDYEIDIIANKNENNKCETSKLKIINKLTSSSLHIKQNFKLEMGITENINISCRKNSQYKNELSDEKKLPQEINDLSINKIDFNLKDNFYLCFPNKNTKFKSSINILKDTKKFGFNDRLPRISNSYSKEKIVVNSDSENRIYKLGIIDNYVQTEKLNKSVIEEYYNEKLDSLEKYISPNNYKIYIEASYNSLIEWLINKSKKLSKFDETDNIINSYVLDIIIKLFSKIESNFLLNCLEDFYILMNIKDNITVFFKNSLFYQFLIETTYSYFIKNKNRILTTNLDESKLYQVGIKIHTDLIINYIGKDEKHRTEPINKLHFLLSWGIYFKNLYSNQKSNHEINEFIKFLFFNLIENFKIKINEKEFSPSVSYAIWENYVSFSILFYEYMVFYNMDKYLKDCQMPEIFDEDTIVTPTLFIINLNYKKDKRQDEFYEEDKIDISKSDLSEKSNLKSLSLDNLWSDYNIFKMNYEIISKIFCQKFSNMKLDKIVNDIIFNKNQKDLFIENVKLLFYTFKPNDQTIYNNNLAKTISNSFAIIITIVRDENEIQYWVEEYEKFILFIIIASSNLNENTNKSYFEIQDITLDIILFGLSLFIDQYFNNKIMTPSSKKIYCNVIKNIFTILTLIYEKIIDFKEKKNFLNISLNTKIYDNSAIYRMFHDLIIDHKSKLPLINKNKILEFKECQFSTVPIIFHSKEWKKCLMGNPLIKDRMKQLFDKSSYEKIIRGRYEAFKNYRPYYNLNKSPEENNKDFQKVKKRLYETIEGKISRFENDYKNVKNNIYNKYLENKFLYKKLKKELFKWRGFWADKKLYYEEMDKLKLKIMNHYTSFNAKIILSPIIDIDYYLPKFEKFELNKLFRQNNKNNTYKIKINFNEIFADLEPLPEKNLNNEMNNILYDFYKYTSKKIWNLIENLSNLSLNYHDPQNFTSKNENDKESFECCLVKLSHHIKGKLIISKEFLSFIPINIKYYSDGINTDNDYHKEKKTCYGSTLKFQEKENDKIIYKWNLKDIKLIFKRRYYLRKKAIEIFTCNNKSYFFTFKSQTKRDNVMKNISQLLKINIRKIKIDTMDSNFEQDIGIENIFPEKRNKSLKLSNFIEKWANWKLSNFEILMIFNFYGNRSYVEMNQYPVFPWILTDYKEKDINFDKHIRDLSSPMGMLELNKKGKDRKKGALEKIKESDSNSSETHYNYGSHYSTPFYLVHYLIRLFPLTQMHIELQGDGSIDKRLFVSISDSFINASSGHGDFRELIPEFFYLPEMFQNINNIDFDLGENSFTNDVELPEWANKSSFIFVAKMKEILESEEISYKLNEWIDLIFGYKQKGKEAELHGNLFKNSTYEDYNYEKNEDQECTMMEVENGLTPHQLLSKHMIGKIKKDHLKRGKQVTELKELKMYSRKFKSKEKLLMLTMNMIDNEKILCVFSNNTVICYKYSQTDNKNSISIETTKQISSDKEFKHNQKIPYYYSESINSPCLIYNCGKIIAQAGYFDGRITIILLEQNIKSYSYYTDKNFPIGVLKIDEKENFMFAGSKSGSLYIFEVNKEKLELYLKLNDHSQDLISIAICNNLNVFATSSLDGYVNLYTFPEAKIFRSLFNQGGFSDNVFLSAYPLPCFITYSKETQKLKTYGINGHLIISGEIEEHSILSPIVFTDQNFNDYLIYGNIKGELKIRKFPWMKIIHCLNLNKKGDSYFRPIKCIEISDDKKMIFFWQNNESELTLVKEPSQFLDSSILNFSDFR